MLVVDAYIKWPEVVVLESTTAETAIKYLQQIFATHGLPLQIVLENGPQFTAEKLQVLYVTWDMSYYHRS